MPLFNEKIVAAALHSFDDAITDSARQAAVDWAARAAHESFDLQNESQLEQDFNDAILKRVLGFVSPKTGAPGTMQVKQPIPGGTTVDVALGHFHDGHAEVIAPLELKGPKVALDRIMPGRAKTPVQQAWDYAMDAPGASWVMLSNMKELRLYAFGHPLSAPKPLTPADAHRMAKEYFEHWLPSAETFFQNATDNVERARPIEAAFLLHQTTERLYICFLLVRTLYFPRSHNIKFLRSLAEDKEPRLVDAWPRETKKDRARFERLKRAYVEARYSASYSITTDDLDALAACVARLREIVEEVCRERLAGLEAQAAA